MKGNFTILTMEERLMQSLDELIKELAKLVAEITKLLDSLEYLAIKRIKK